jgi:cytochrome c
MQPGKLFIASVVAEALLLAFSPPADSADAAKGKDLFERRCSGCHSVDMNKEGPRLRGVFGRKAAGLADFTYSDSLKKLNIHWDDSTLERWLTNPDAMAPDTDMAFRVNSPDERKAVIAYLKSLTTQ